MEESKARTRARYTNDNSGNMLVMGAELLCTKSKICKEKSLLMVSADHINNALFNGIPVANRKNHIKDKDIIPFSYCTKGKGIIPFSDITSLGDIIKEKNTSNATCADTMVTDDLWENLTMPFDDAKIPYFNLLGNVKGLNQGTDEALFKENYNEVVKEQKGTDKKSYHYSNKELRRNAILRTYTDKNAAEDASLTVNSFLLCSGHGGIIYPNTSGQQPVINKQMVFEWVLSLPYDPALDGAYKELAELFLYDLDCDEMAIFIGRCFDFDARFPYMLNRIAVADRWKPNEDKFNKLLGHMLVCAAEDYYASKSPEDMEKLLDILHKILLFDSAQYIKDPVSEIGASRPHILISNQTEFYQPIGTNGEKHEYNMISYVLDYRKYTFHDVSRSTSIVPQKITAYHPANGKYPAENDYPEYDPLATLEIFLGRNKGIELENRIVSSTDGIDDVLIVQGIESATAGVPGVGLLISVADAAREVVEHEGQVRIIILDRNTSDSLAVIINTGRIGGVSVFTDESINHVIRDYSSAFDR